VLLHASGVMEHGSSIGVAMRGDAAMRRRVSSAHGVVHGHGGGGQGEGQGEGDAAGEGQGLQVFPQAEAELAARRQAVLASGLKKMRSTMFRMMMVWRFRRADGPASSRINRALLRAMLWERAHGVGRDGDGDGDGNGDGDSGGDRDGGAAFVPQHSPARA